jgi:Ca2+-binding RTX toxin-like protein
VLEKNRQLYQCFVPPTKYELVHHADILLEHDDGRVHTWLVGQSTDTIVDFSQAQNDKIELSASGFGGGLTLGELDSNQFTLGSSASDSSDRLIYDNSTGGLFFDADGIGTQKQVQFATLSGGLALNHSDFVIV